MSDTPPKNYRRLNPVDISKLDHDSRRLLDEIHVAFAKDMIAQGAPFTLEQASQALQDLHQHGLITFELNGDGEHIRLLLLSDDMKTYIPWAPTVVH